MKDKTKSNIITGLSASAGAAVGVTAAGVAFATDMNAENTNQSSMGHLADNGGGQYEPFKESAPTPSPEDLDIDEVTVVQGEMDSSPMPDENFSSDVDGVRDTNGGGGGGSNLDSDYESDYGLVGNPSDHNAPTQTEVMRDDVPVGEPTEAPSATWDDGYAGQDPNADDVEIFLSDDSDGGQAQTAPEGPAAPMAGAPDFDANADDVEIFLSDDDNDFNSKDMNFDESDVEPFVEDNDVETSAKYGFSSCDGGDCGGDDDVDLEVLGVETVETEDGDMDIVSLTVDGEEAYVIDADQDGLADVMAVDADGDGELSDEEMIDVTEDEIEMDAFSEGFADEDADDGGFFGEDDPYEDTDMYGQDDIAQDASGDYINDANVDDYIA